MHVRRARRDAEVAPLRLDRLGVKLTTRSASQAGYLGINADGPDKPEQYRY